MNYSNIREIRRPKLQLTKHVEVLVVFTPSALLWTALPCAIDLNKLPFSRTGYKLLWKGKIEFDVNSLLNKNEFQFNNVALR